jgi:predicted small lipoprotein YifL
VTRRGPGSAVVLAVLAGGALAGCGLKGALTLPEKSESVVIRGQPAEGAGSTTEGGVPPAQAPAGAPAEEKLPPPELPHSSSGPSR